MKLFEKILLCCLLLAFLTQPFLEHQDFLRLSIWVLMLSYGIGGYWLLNSEESKQYFLPILSGIVFATSIYTWPSFILMEWCDNVKLILPAINGILFLGLFIYLIVKRKSSNNPSNIKAIFLRSFAILVITCFLAYTPVNFKIARKIFIALNNGNEQRVSNILMVEYTDQFDKAYKNSEYDEAISMAQKANQCGLIWLGVITKDTREDSFMYLAMNDTFKLNPADQELNEKTNQNKDSSELWLIGRTYDNLYVAYLAKAKHEFKKNNFNEELYYYMKADSAIRVMKKDRSNREQSLNNIALCYDRMKRYTMADTFYSQAMNIFIDSKDTMDQVMAGIISNAADNLSHQHIYSLSNKLFRTANAFYRKDSLNNNSKEDLIDNYNKLTLNFIAQDSIELAIFYAQKALSWEKSGSQNYCLTSLHYGICLYRISQYEKADSVLQNSLQCLQTRFNPDHPYTLACKFALSQTEIALALYKDARKLLNEGLSAAKANKEIDNTMYISFLLASAHLHKVTGEYKAAQSEYNTLLNIINNAEGEGTLNKAITLSAFSDLEVCLSRFSSAKEHSDEALGVIEKGGYMNQSNQTSLFNEIAYVNYSVGLYRGSDTLYNKVVNMNRSLGLSHATTSAIAFNGLGLNATARRNYKLADSLFIKALQLHLSIFHENNPLTAIVYLNYGLLNIQEGKLTEAEEKLNRAMEIDKKFFDSSHDIFGDIYVALGDLSKKQGKRDVAKAYYQKALDIYLAKFDVNHWKVVSTKRKL